jgi:hypothetical protein
MAFLTDARGVMMSDQASLSFVQNNLSYIEPQVYERKYQNADYRRHLSVVTEGQAWAASSTWYAMDKTGEAKFITGQATDIPYVGLTRDQFNAPNYMIASGFTWNVEEANQALITNTNLSAELPLTSRQVVERGLYQVAITGKVNALNSVSEKGLTGLINDPGVFSYTVAATGTGSSTFWANKTPDQILFDVNTLLGGIPTATAQIEYADTLRLPPSAMRYISSVRLGNGDGSLTILRFLRENNILTAETGQPLDIQSIPELETAGAGGNGRMVAYRNAPEVVRFSLPMPFMLLPVRSRSILSFEGAGIARTGGTQIRLTGAIRYADGITQAS